MTARRGPARRKRNYRAEYRRRIKNALDKGLTRSQGRGHPRKGELPAKKESVAKVVRDDAKRTFRKVPKLEPDAPRIDSGGRSYPDPSAYEEYLRDKVKREGSKFDWFDEQEFISSVTALGMTEREAYTLWFSP